MASLALRTAGRDSWLAEVGGELGGAPGPVGRAPGAKLSQGETGGGQERCG